MTIAPARTTVTPRIEIGPESGDHVSVRILHRLDRHPTDDSGWLVCPVHVHVGGFSGDVATALHAREVHRFGSALRAVRQGLRRTAVLESAEDWIDLTVSRESDGALTVSGYLADEPGVGSRLRFRIGGLTDADLDAWVAACDAVDAMHLSAA